MYFAQTTDYTCAIACIMMILKELEPDKDYDEMELAKICNTTDDKGTHPDDIISYFKSKGYSASYKQNGTIDDLERFTQDGKYIIMIISVDVPHCIVYRGHNNNHFFFDDPWYGEKQSRVIKKFEKGGQKYPLMRWEVETDSLKKYYPTFDFSKVESYVGKRQYIVIN